VTKSKRAKSHADSLTDRQRAVYNFIRELIQRRGYGPTVREIATEFDIRSPNGVVCHLKALVKKGLIIRDPNKARAIELTQPALERRKPRHREEEGLAFAGFVPAGFTNHAFELNERIDFGQMFSGQDLFVLRVKGDSMIEAHVADGDYVICRSVETAEPGQMVVALNDEDEATLKYWHPESRRIRLQPANSAMKPIYVKNARVRGVVIGVVRSDVS
jgi:repressor LexA